MARGFEPAGLVGQAAARAMHLPFQRALTLRKRPRPQKGLTKAQRRENVRAAFAVSLPVKGRTLLLVDDVTTTGATLRAAAAALARAGATVYAATFAQTPRRDPDLYGRDEGEVSEYRSNGVSE
jgi:predicted amidophosphoribosyltransferase